MEDLGKVLVSPGVKYFDFNLKYLYVVGLWHYEGFINVKKEYYMLYQRQLYILSFLYLFFTTIGTLQIENNFELLMSNIDKTLVGYGLVFKVLSFEINRKDMETLIEDIMLSGDKITRKCNERMKHMVIFATVLVTSLTSMFFLFSLYEGVMTVESWMPFDTLKSKARLYGASQILATCFLVPCAWRGTALQGIVCSLLMYFCEQCKELQNRIKTLQYKPEHKEVVRKEFIEIVRKHVRLIRYSKIMEDSFKQYFLIHNLAMSVEICLNALMISSVVGTQQKRTLLNFLVFLIITLLNTYIYCYLGNEMIVESAGIAQAAYESSWTSWPLDMQKDLLTLITVAQRPLKLSAGGLSLVSLQTYCQILYNGYSIFAMLHDMI